MSFAILGCHDLRHDGKAWLRIRNPGCCAKTFPDFFAVLDRVRQNSPAPS
jgi:3-phosphoshikimate 1-carboxyvinyltransferase